MKRKRPTRDSAAAKYRRALEGQRKAFAHLMHVTSLYVSLTKNLKEHAKSGNQQAKSL